VCAVSVIDVLAQAAAKLFLALARERPRQAVGTGLAVLFQWYDCPGTGEVRWLVRGRCGAGLLARDQ
jgi:hypothetical protein